MTTYIIFSICCNNFGKKLLINHVNFTRKASQKLLSICICISISAPFVIKSYMFKLKKLNLKMRPLGFTLWITWERNKKVFHDLTTEELLKNFRKVYNVIGESCILKKKKRDLNNGESLAKSREWFFVQSKVWNEFYIWWHSRSVSFPLVFIHNFILSSKHDQLCINTVILKIP